MKGLYVHQTIHISELDSAGMNLLGFRCVHMKFSWPTILHQQLWLKNGLNL